MIGSDVDPLSTSVPASLPLGEQTRGRRHAPLRGNSKGGSDENGQDLPVGPSEVYESDRRALRIKTAVVAIALALLTLFSLRVGSIGVGTTAVNIHSFGEVFSALGSGARIGLGRLFGFVSQSQAFEIMHDTPWYSDITQRFSLTLVTLACGLMLSVAGMLYQNAFRNPIAAPTMLGVTSGVELGTIVFVLQMGGNAVLYREYMTLYGYVGGVIVLGIVLLVGKLTSGGKRGMFNVANMIVVGAMVSQLAGILISTLSQTVLTGDLYTVYALVTGGVDISLNPLSICIVLVTLLATMLPISLRAFDLNLLTFSDEEMRLGGIDSSVARGLVLAAGSVMILAAQTQIGSIAVISLAVPFLARALFGSEFRKQLLGTSMLGMLIVLGCQVLSALIPFGGTGIPMSTIASIALLPLFTWIVAASQSRIA